MAAETARPSAAAGDPGVRVPSHVAVGLKPFDAGGDPFADSEIAHTRLPDIAAGQAQVGFQVRALRSLGQDMRVYATQIGTVPSDEASVVMVITSSRLGPFSLIERTSGPLTQATLVDSVNVCTNCDYGKEITLANATPGIVTRVPGIATTVSWISGGVLFVIMGPYELGPDRALEIANDVG